MRTRFYKCEHCGNVVLKVVDSGVPVVCCGEKMKELKPDLADEGAEKHVPVFKDLGQGKWRVEVGRVHHPMTQVHHIAFVYVETDRGGIRVDLKDEPVADVFVGDARVLAVYEYCNLHGLWMLEL